VSKSVAASQNEELWKILVETVHALPMYKNHKHYVENVMIKEKPDISSKELAVQLNIPLGEAMVLLTELRGDKQEQTPVNKEGPQKTTEKSLLDFSA
jgi:hypothetical protein